MREAKPAWLAMLRAVSGAEADLRFNTVVGRWEFILPSADGVPRSQFWGQFYIQHADGSRTPLDPDPVTGLHAFRDLDDQVMVEVCENLRRTDIRAPGRTGNTRKEIQKTMDHNSALAKKAKRARAEDFADRIWDRRRQMHELPLIHVPVVIGGRR